MRILIAPNSFKNSLDATSCAEAIAQGLMQSNLPCECTLFPVGDGGDGTALLLNKKWNVETIHVSVHDALKRPIPAAFGFIDKNKTAIIEMADASGLKLLQPYELNSLHASSYGTGEMITHALDRGAEKIILCIGGSATVDGGTGILQALGFQFLNKTKNELEDIPADLIRLSMIDDAKTDKRIFNCELIVLCDVENILLGSNGAAAVFAPQKGATAEDVVRLEQCLQQLRNVTYTQKGIDMNLIKHGGAAGGVAASLAAWLNAKLVNGIDYFLQVTKFTNAIQNTDLLITGEGSIDTQTLQGKAPYGVAKMAKENNIPVIGFAGKIPQQNNDALNQYFDVMLSINNESNIQEAMLHTKENLMRTATLLGNVLALRK